MSLIFFPQYKKGKTGMKIHPGLTILDYLQQAGLEINAECGGKGTCGKCAVRIEKGEKNLNEPTGPEKKWDLEQKERLACQARVIRDEGDMQVFIKNFGRYEILKYGMERSIPLCPAFFREAGRVCTQSQPVDDYRGKIYGLAIDVGTTTVVFDVVDLENGNILATMARTNPQISYGNDVISRIEYTMVDKEARRYLSGPEKAERLKRLQHLIVEGINHSLQELSSDMGQDISGFIYDAVVVGNSTMRNIFFGLDVSNLGIKPFEPESKAAVTRKPEEINLSINPNGRIYGAALIGSHVGADVLADILASEMYKSKDICMLVDIGTNGEVVLGNQDRLICASCAAGGAFEGNSVTCGTGAIEGAIKEIRILDGKVVHSTIGNKYPIGVCGSGLIDLLAELLRHNLMSRTARIEQDFYITGEIKITQADIFQLITSKSALKTGAEILMNCFPAGLSDVQRIHLSGGFGNFINTVNAMEIGIIPKVPVEKVVKIGNGALEGAREMLLCRNCRSLSEDLARKVEHVRTNEVEKDFDNLIARNMYFE